jgi:16S rRNA U516 pseudouridylate synthase RsuA-like enzyme
MTRNITLALDEGILREARVLAAHQGLSVSGLLRRQLVHLVENERGYAKARTSAL